MSKKQTGGLAPSSRASTTSLIQLCLVETRRKESWWSGRPSDDVDEAVLSVVLNKDLPIWKLRCAVACGGGEKRSGREVAGDGNEMYDMCAQNRIQGLKMSFVGEPSLPNASLFLRFFLLGIAICAAGRENEAMGEFWWSNREKNIMTDNGGDGDSNGTKRRHEGGRGKGRKGRVVCW